MMDRSHLNQKHMKNANSLQEFVHKKCPNVHHLHGHMPGDAFCTGKLQCQLCPVGNRTIPQLSIPSVSSLRTVNEQKVNVDILHSVNLCTYFHDIWHTCWTDDKKITL